MSRTILAILAVVFVSGCSPAFNGRWDGSGEIGEARFFSFSADMAGRPPMASFEYAGGQSMRTAICDISMQDGHVKFLMDPTLSVEDCSTLVSPLVFVGEFGRDVVTGNVLERSSDGTERLVGLFRAFRYRKP